MKNKNNAIKHGLLRKKVRLLPDESRYLFSKLNRSLLEHWRPANLAERLLVEQLAFSYWRLKRAYKLETELLEKAEEEAKLYSKPNRPLRSVEQLKLDDFDRLRRYISSI